MSVTTNEQRRIFAENGWVVVPGVLSAPELERYGAAVDRGVAARSAHDPRPLEARTLYEQSFRQCINLWEDREDVRPLTFHPRIAQIAAELLDVPALRLWHDQALYKEAGGRETDPHHDQPYWPLVETNNITAWIAFDGADLETGCMGFVPGSHRFPQTPESPDAPTDVEVRSLEMPAGAVMIFHGSLWHGGGPNTTADEWRLGVNVQYCPGFVRQQQNHYLAIPPEVAATFSDRLLELLGYRLYKGIMGHVDGRSPGEVVFGDRFAETAYRDAESRRSPLPDA